MNNSNKIIAWIGRLLLLILLLIAFCFFLLSINTENNFHMFFTSLFGTITGGYILYRITGAKKYIKTKKRKAFEEGMEFYNKEDYSKAMQVWLPLAGKSYQKKNWLDTKISIIAVKIKKSWGGYAEAQCKLGEMYEDGIGVVQDYKKAFYWYEKGARQEHAQSQAKLGYLYRKGLGVKQNNKKAIELYEKAAKQGNASGQNNLGHVYDFGYGVSKNYEKALYWYGKAAEQAHAITQNNIGYMYSEGVGVKQNHKEAVKWFKQSAKNGDEAGQYNLARMYEEGEGVEQSNFHAYKWFYIANENKDEEAKGKLNEIAKMMTEDEVAEAEKLAKQCIKSKYKDCGDPSEYDA